MNSTSAEQAAGGMRGQHTPGPWAIDPDTRPGMEWNNHIVQANNPNMTICFMTHTGTDDNSKCEANASLIAAAPELLAALRDVISWVPGRAAFHTDEPGKAVERARAVIAKATGAAA